MKRSKLQWITATAAVVLIAVGSAGATAEESSDELAGNTKTLGYAGDEPSGVATVSYVGDLPCGNCDGGCDNCSGGSCDAGGCSGCDSGSCDTDGCSGCGACKGKGGFLSSLFGHGCSGGDCGGASGLGRSYGRPDLFYNYFTQGYANRTNAQMYMSPLPVPPNVGHTYFTYQPYYPHELLYWHKDKFHNYYDNGRGMNRTRAVYYSPPIRQAVSNFYWNKIRLPR